MIVQSCTGVANWSFLFRSRMTERDISIGAVRLSVRPSLSSISCYHVKTDACRITRFLGERYGIKLALCRHISVLSVVCLYVICDVRAPYSQGWTFRQYFAPSYSLKTRTVCMKILETKFKGVSGKRAVKWKGVWKIGVLRPISRFISKKTIHSYNERRIETCMRSIEWCHFQ